MNVATHRADMCVLFRFILKFNIIFVMGSFVSYVYNVIIFVDTFLKFHNNLQFNLVIMSFRFNILEIIYCIINICMLKSLFIMLYVNLKLVLKSTMDLPNIKLWRKLHTVILFTDVIGFIIPSICLKLFIMSGIGIIIGVFLIFEITLCDRYYKVEVLYIKSSKVLKMARNQCNEMCEELKTDLSNMTTIIEVPPYITFLIKCVRRILFMRRRNILVISGR